MTIVIIIHALDTYRVAALLAVILNHFVQVSGARNAIECAYNNLVCLLTLHEADEFLIFATLFERALFYFVFTDWAEWSCLLLLIILVLIHKFSLITGRRISKNSRYTDTAYSMATPVKIQWDTIDL